MIIHGAKLIMIHHYNFDVEINTLGKSRCLMIQWIISSKLDVINSLNLTGVVMVFRFLLLIRIQRIVSY